MFNRYFSEWTCLAKIYLRASERVISVKQCRKHEKSLLKSRQMTQDICCNYVECSSLSLSFDRNAFLSLSLIHSFIDCSRFPSTDRHRQKHSPCPQKPIPDVILMFNLTNLCCYGLLFLWFYIMMNLSLCELFIKASTISLI